MKKTLHADDSCLDCPYHGVQYSAGEFARICKADGTRIEKPPVFCPYKPSIPTAISVLMVEKECVTRASAGACDRDCGKCDLVLDDKDIITAYDQAIAALQEKLLG